MKTSFGQIWEYLRTSLWFVPAILTAVAIGLSVAVIQLDKHLEAPTIDTGLAWIFEGGPEGAAQIMSAIATSIITVAGVVFSITIVALTLASNQFSPRVLRQFTSDHANQLVLGAFIATFIYSLLVLRSIRAEEGNEFTPYLGVTLGVLLAIISMGMLIFFIHHIAAAIQASTIINSIAHETTQLMNNLFPEELGHEHTQLDEETEEFNPEGEPAEISSPHMGYLQTIDEASLLAISKENDLTLRLEHSIGDFLAKGVTLATVWPADRLTEKVSERLANAIAVGRTRTMQQDTEFGISQISEIAVKALSPGVNDPSTAVACVDHLGGILRHMGNRAIPSRFRRDEDGNVRVLARGMDFESATNLAFDEIRRNSEQEVMTTLHLLDAIATIAETATLSSRRDTLRRQVLLISAGAGRGIKDPSDRADVLDRAQRTLTTLDEEMDRAA